VTSRDEPIEAEKSTGEVLVVAAAAVDTSIIDDLRRRFPDRPIATCDSLLSAISTLNRRRVHAVLAGVNGSQPRLEDAVAGLREAAGDDARIILCCVPEAEPVARRALAAGADDYIVYPLMYDEVDTALGLTRPFVWREHRLTAAPAASLAELDLLGKVLSQIDEKPIVLLETLASLVRRALQADGVTVVVSGSVATSGEAVARPVLTAPMTGDSGVAGQLLVGARRCGPYTPDDTQKLTHYAAIAGHILKAAFRQRHLRDMAHTDELSDLPNRRCFHEALGQTLSQARSDRLPVTLLMCDIDDFKTYNDEYGHDAGDEIIKTTAELFRRYCREHDLVARYGGDEFVVVFWDPRGPRVAGSTHPACAFDVLKRFKEALRSHKFNKLGARGHGQLTISGGLASFPWDADTADALITRADEALLQAKRGGKDRIYLIGEHQQPRNSAAG